MYDIAIYSDPELFQTIFEMPLELLKLLAVQAAVAGSGDTGEHPGRLLGGPNSCLFVDIN